MAVCRKVSKMAAGVIDSAAISFYRWLIAGALMTPFMLTPLWRQRSTVLRHLPKLAVLGLLGMVMYQCLAYVAAQHTSATNMGLLACLAYAAYGVLLKRWALPLTCWQSLFVQIWCANVILFVYYLYRHGLDEPAAPCNRDPGAAHDTAVAAASRTCSF
jgi:drug/metabolite transporter (DMT)-like permease